MSVINAAERAWEFNLNKCLTYQYLVAVSHAAIVAYFVTVNAYPDHIEPNRAVFIIDKNYDTNNCR